MKNKKIVWLISILLIVFGLILTTIGFVTNTKRGLYFNGSGIHILGKDAYEEKNMNLEQINEIDINTSYFNILFEKSNYYGIEIISYDGDNKINWDVQDGKLTINETSENNFRIFSFDFGFLDNNKSSYIKIYLPKDIKLNLLSIYSKNSDISLSNLDVQELNLENKYGKTVLEKMQIDHMQVLVNNGDFSSQNIIANKINLDSEYGNVIMKQLDTNLLQLELKNGNLKLNDISSKTSTLKSKYGNIIGKSINFINNYIESKNGKIDLSGDFSGNSEFVSTYGDIILNVTQEKEYYNLDLNTKYGDIILDGDINEDNKMSQIGQNNDMKLKLTTKSGNISLCFNP